MKCKAVKFAKCLINVSGGPDPAGGRPVGNSRKPNDLGVFSLGGGSFLDVAAARREDGGDL
jgi:hypothetical protein